MSDMKTNMKCVGVNLIEGGRGRDLLEVKFSMKERPRGFLLSSGDGGGTVSIGFYMPVEEVGNYRVGAFYEMSIRRVLEDRDNDNEKLALGVSDE